MMFLRPRDPSKEIVPPGLRAAAHARRRKNITEAGLPCDMFDTDHDVRTILLRTVLVTTQTVYTVQCVSLVCRHWNRTVKMIMRDCLLNNRTLRLSIGNLLQMRWFGRVAPQFESLQKIQLTYRGDGRNNSNGRMLDVGSLERTYTRGTSSDVPSEKVEVPGVGELTQVRRNPHTEAEELVSLEGTTWAFSPNSHNALERERADGAIPTSYFWAHKDDGPADRVAFLKAYAREWTLTIAPDFVEVVQKCANFWKHVSCITYVQGRHSAQPHLTDLRMDIGRRPKPTTGAAGAAAEEELPPDVQLNVKHSSASDRANTAAYFDCLASMIAEALHHNVPVVVTHPTMSLLSKLVDKLVGESRLAAYRLMIIPDVQRNTLGVFGLRATRCTAFMNEHQTHEYSLETLKKLCAILRAHHMW